MFTFICLTVLCVICVGAYSCQDDWYFDGKTQVCLPCRKCLSTQFMKQNCTAFSNRQCLECNNGTYLKDNECRNCSACPFGTVQHCTKTTDAECNFKEHTESCRWKIYIIVAVVVIFRLCVILVVAYRKKKCKNRQEEQLDDEPDELESMNENGNIKSED